MNISTIAEMAGVSRAAVSRYLNDGYVSEEKRERIREVIEQTGYQPSVQAQMLRTRQSRLIGVILPEINDDSAGRILSGISEILYQNGYQLLLAETGSLPTRERECIRNFQNNQVDGVILIGSLVSASHRKLLKNMSIPVVVTGQKADYLSCVYHDDYMAAKEMTTLLLKKGRRKLGMISITEKDAAAGKARKNGFLDAVKEWEDGAEAFIEEGGLTVSAGFAAAGRLFTEYPDLDGLFCATDSIAAGAIEYMQSTGRQIPKDVSVTGIGHSELAQVVTPKLTTAHYYYKACGSEAATLLLSIMKNQAGPVKSIQLRYQIVEQESV